jgi:hypothetical protein
MRHLLNNRDDLQRMGMSTRVRAADFAACRVVTQVEDAYLSPLVWLTGRLAIHPNA